MASLDISVDRSVADVLALGVVVIDEVGPRPDAGPALDRLIEERIAGLTRRIAAPGELDGFVADARKLYKRFRIDPTKYRPSSEQLMRRVTRGDPFPRVNPLVDAVNLCQLEERLPYGLYDLDAVEPPIIARIGRAGEEYAGIRKGEIHLDGKPALFDARGGFGNPTSDSDRAKTSTATRRALAVVFGSPEMPPAAWEEVLDRTGETLLGAVSGRVVERRVVRGGGAA